MQYKQNNLKRPRSAKGLVLKAAAGVLVAIFLPLIGTAPSAFAATDASFSISSSGSKTVGGTFTVVVTETSSSAVNAVQANVSYPTAQLQYKSMTLGAFQDLCPQKTAGSGTVQIGCASTGTYTGKQTIVTLTFSVVGSGSGQVKMLSGSDIDNTSGTSVWDGTLTSATYAFSAATQSGGSSGGSTGGTTKKKTTPAPSAPKTSPSTNTNPATNPSKPATTTTPQTTTQQPATTPASTAALTITVTDSNGKPVKGAKVSVDSTYSAITDANGKASLSGLAIGSHKVSVTAAGKTTTATTLKLDANEDKQVSLKLAAKQSLTPVIYVVLGVLVLGGGAVALLKLRGGGGVRGPQLPVSGIVVGSGNIPATPTQPTTTVQPTATQPSTPQVVTSAQPPANPGTSDDTTPKIQ